MLNRRLTRSGPQPLRIVLFCAYPYPASKEEPLCCGGQYHPFYLSQALSRAGAEVRIIARRKDGQPYFQRSDGLEIHRYPSLHHLGGYKRGISLSLNRLRLFRRLLRREHVDWVITFSPLFWELPLLRGTVPLCFMIPGVNMGFAANLNGSPLEWLRKMFIAHFSRPLMQKNLESARLAFVNCRNDLSLVKLFYRPSAAVLLSPNGVDVDLYRPDPQVSSAPVLLSVGRFSPEKGFHDVIAAACKVKPAFPKLILRLIGFAYDEPYLRRIRQTLAKDSLSSWIQIQTNVPESEMPAIMSSSRGCVVFSSGYDPLPSVILQSMSCGVPVISTDWPPRREIVVDGQNGFLVPEGDLDQLADRMHRLLLDPDAAQRLGRNARSTAETQRNFDIITQNLISTLRCSET